MAYTGQILYLHQSESEHFRVETPEVEITDNWENLRSSVPESLGTDENTHTGNLPAVTAELQPEEVVRRAAVAAAPLASCRTSCCSAVMNTGARRLLLPTLVLVLLAAAAAARTDVLELGDADFDYLATEYETMLVKFYAPW